MTEKLKLKIAVKDPMAVRSIDTILKEDAELEVVDPKSREPVDLMLLDLDGSDPQMVERIEAYLAAKTANELFLMAEHPEADLLMKLMRVGVKEFLPLPLDRDEFKAAVERFKKRAAEGGGTKAPKNGRVISVLGSKGGVGTTTVAVNLAVSLAKSPTKPSVTLFDMNTLFGEIPLFLDLTPKFHWGEITKGIDRLDDIFLMNILSKHTSGVHLLPSPASLNGNNAPTMEVIDRLTGLMRTLFDYLIVDAGQSMEDASLRMLQQSDEVMLVSLLNMPCLSNTNRLMKSLTELGYVAKDQLNVVVNRHLKRNEISIKDAEAGIEKEISWVIPNDYRNTMAAINQGKPLDQVAPKAPITAAFQGVARTLLPEEGAKKKRKWRFF
jgi:pilus assembly protein CpaE